MSGVAPSLCSSKNFILYDVRFNKSNNVQLSKYCCEPSRRSAVSIEPLHPRNLLVLAPSGQCVTDDLMFICDNFRLLKEREAEDFHVFCIPAAV